MAIAAGPVIGGVVIDGLSWHWIFLLNVPIGLVLIPVAVIRLTESFGPRPHLDVVGVVLAGLGFLGLTWGLVRANTIGWGTSEVIGTVLAGALLIGLFLVWERRVSSPMVPLGLFAARGFAAVNLVGFFLMAGVFGTLFLVMQLLQTALGYSPLQAGLRLLPYTATVSLVMPLAGRLATRYGSRPFMALGLVLQAIGLGWMAAIASPGMGYGELAAALIVAGVGASLCWPTAAIAVVGSVPPQEAGVASGTHNTLRQLGGVFGVAVLAAVFTHEGGYSTGRTFVDGFAPALLVGAGLSALGVVAALLSSGRLHPERTARVAPLVSASAEVRETPSERAS